jgi:hypothetical protein
MSKNTAKKKNQVNSDAAPAAIVATETAAPVVDSPAAEIAALTEKLAVLNKQKAEIEAKELATLNETKQKERDLIDSLMAPLSVNSLDDVIARIEARQKMDRTSNRGNVISEETKQAIEKVLRSKNPPTAANIAENYKVSIPWIQLFKGKLGLVKTRTPAV